MKDFLLNKKIKISKWISWQIYDDCVYIIDERTEFIFSLEGTASYFWEYLINFKTINLVLKNLKEKFDYISSEDIKDDLIVFIKVLTNQEIIEVV
ncbi:hypothetical protein JCM30566_19550 [Marinitoga arctica]